MAHPLHNGEAASPCSADGACQMFWPGHAMHWIHAKHVGRTPWGWRYVTVAQVIDRAILLVTYPDGHPVTVWHHGTWTDRIRPGQHLGLHEGYYSLRTGRALLNVAIENGRGAVPEPDDLDAWAERITGGVQDLRTGDGVAVGGAGLPPAEKDQR